MSISVTVKILRSEPAVTVVCSSEVLCFYCHWFCSTDISVGLMFKRQHSESPYDKSVTVTGTVFTERTIAGQHLVKYCHNNLHERPTDGSVDDVKSHTDGQTDGMPAGCVQIVTIS